MQDFSKNSSNRRKLQINRLQIKTFYEIELNFYKIISKIYKIITIRKKLYLL